MPSKQSAAVDRMEVGAFFGFVAGLLTLGIVTAWLLLKRLVSGDPFSMAAVLLHAGYILLYALSGALIGNFWPLGQTMVGRWGLWLIATATGALSVNSVAHGPVWSWSLINWGHYGLMTILLVPVLASPRAKSKP